MAEMKVVDLAACGDLNGVKELLANKATTKENVNSMDKDGRSAFHYSCLNDDVNLMKVLLADDRVDVALRTPKEDTGVHLAALYASLGALNTFLADKRGKELINSQNKYGETPLHLCAGSGDKGAAKAAKLLLSLGASLLVADKWGRGPIDVSKDNAENPLVKVFDEYIASKGKDFEAKVKAMTEGYKAQNEKAPELNKGVLKQKAALFSGLGGALKGLKKVEVSEKQMFSNTAGTVVSGKPKGKDLRFQGKILSKLIDFPGDAEEIRKLLDNPEVSPGGKDAYGLTALHKFASWNKTQFMEMLIPKLTPEEINATDQDGKTALHWACQMASVAAVSYLVKIPEVDTEIKDKNGLTPRGILDSVDETPVIKRIRLALDGK